MSLYSEQIAANKDVLELQYTERKVIVNAGFMIDGVVYHINRIESLYDPKNLSSDTTYEIKHEFHALANRVGQFVTYLDAEPKINHTGGMVDKYFFARNHYTAHRAMDKHSKNKAAQKPEYHLPELSVGFGGEMRHDSKIIFQFIKNMSKTDYFDLEPTSDRQILIEEMKKLLQDKITAIQTKNRPTITRAGGEDSIALTQSG